MTNKNDFRKIRAVGFVSVGALVVTLTGCIMPGPHGYHGPGPSVQVEAGVVAQHDYVYYPGYEVYYSRNTRQYVYLDGRSWIARPAPSRVSVDVLFAAPSVAVDFHDHPSRHHATVVRQYPKHWAPPGASHGDKPGHDKGRK